MTAEDLAARNAEHEEEFWFQLKLAEAEDLAAGFVPLSVIAMARLLLDTEDDLRRAAARPVKKGKR